MTIIKIRILDNNPNGILEIKIANRSGKVIIVPRGELQEFIHTKEGMSRTIYFLFGGSDLEKSFVYIGQTDNFQRRLTQQDATRDDWDIAFGFFSGDNDVDIRYLEGKCIQLARDIGRYEIKNNQIPLKISLDNFGKPVNDEFFEDMNIILNLFRYPIFQKLPKKESAKDIYYFTIGNAKASGILLENNKFMVFEGSTARIEERPGFFVSGKNLRRLLKEEKVLVKNGDTYIFTRDYIFERPSSASGVIAGRNSNGWNEWKNEENKTLDEVKRKK